MSKDELVAMRERYAAIFDRLSARETRLETMRDLVVAEIAKTRTDLTIEIRVARAEIMTELSHLIDMLAAHVSDGHGGRHEPS